MKTHQILNKTEHQNLNKISNYKKTSQMRAFAEVVGDLSPKTRDSDEGTPPCQTPKRLRLRLQVRHGVGIHKVVSCQHDNYHSTIIETCNHSVRHTEQPRAKTVHSNDTQSAHCQHMQQHATAQPVIVHTTSEH